jgi:hypothetical protein
MVMIMLPFVSAVAAEAYVPLARITEPVGVGLPVPLLAVTVTESVCTVVILDNDGVTVIVGVMTTPVPMSEMVCVETSALSTSTADPVMVPTAVGVKLME